MEVELSTETGNKRRRLSQEFVRDKELWMEDGNIIIAATDDTSEEKTTYAFKCHRSILSKQSKVFEGLLDIPPSTETKDLYEGLPLVALPDPCADVKDLLRFLYEPSDIPWIDSHSWDIEQTNTMMKSIEGPLRLAVKYEFTNLRARLGLIVESMWPRTLVDMDARRSWLHMYVKPRVFAPEPVPSATSAIALGYDAQLLDIIPGAFYILNNEVYGLVGVHVVSLPERPIPQERLVQRAESLMSSLPPYCFARFIAGRETLNAVAEDLLKEVLPDVTRYARLCHKKCSNDEDSEDRSNSEDATDNDEEPLPTPCAPAIKKWWSSVLPRRSRQSQIYSDPLAVLARLQEKCVQGGDKTQICFGCRTSIATTLEATSQYIWNELPYIFSVRQRTPGVDYTFPTRLGLRQNFYDGFY